MDISMDEAEIRKVAMVCHTAWYAYTVVGLREAGQPWHTAPEWQKESICAGVRSWNRWVNELTTQEFEELSLESGMRAAIDHLAPTAHQEWSDHKISEGWVFGENKDSDAKTHPCLVDYDQLSSAQRLKDDVALVAYLTCVIDYAESGRW